MSKPRCKHGLAICSDCIVITDAARRIADTMNLVITSHSTMECANAWMAFRLDDGTSDNVLYPSKQEAMDHQSNEFHYCYFFLRGALGGAKPRDCQLWLEFQRHAYDSGHRLAQPNATLIMPLARGRGVNTWLN